MKPTIASILIAGAGRIGSRHLQGLAKCRFPLRIYAQHICEKSLVRAKQRWDEALGSKTLHDVSFHTSFESLPRQLDIAIVATTANTRPQTVSEIANHTAVRFWVLEKILAQSESGLDEIMSHIGGSSSAWVNTSRRMIPWHKQIKLQLGIKHPMTLKVEGGLWGMACNAIHFFDLLAWWTGETLQDINTDHLNTHWFKDKRQGNWEVSGTLESRFSGGSHVLLTSRADRGLISLEVSDDHFLWLIKETQGLAKRSDGIEIPGCMAPQSEMSSSLVESILESGCCELPTLEESIALHRVFIRNMLEHWRRDGNYTATFIPIT
ncbi:MAG: hypothetical protein Q7S46_00975 [Gallionella sp.]|nr:hypothetical protein [Gallionella sp.]